MRKNLLILLFSVMCLTGFSQNGKLGKAKQSLKTSTNTSSVTVKKSTANSSSSSDPVNPIAAILWYPFLYTVYGVVIESPWEMSGRMNDAEIATYPYKEKKYGNFIYTNSTNYNITRFDFYNHLMIENNNLFGNNLGVDFRFFKRFALDVNYTAFLDKTTIETFNMFSALLKYHRIRTQRFDAWFGLGVRRVLSGINQTRFLMGFGAEIFIAKPISLTASYKWATLNQKPVKNTKLHLKYHLKNYRIVTGFEQYTLGVSNLKGFSFGVEASF